MLIVASGERSVMKDLFNQVLTLLVNNWVVLELRSLEKLLILGKLCIEVNLKSAHKTTIQLQGVG